MVFSPENKNKPIITLKNKLGKWMFSAFCNFERFLSTCKGFAIAATMPNTSPAIRA